MKLRKLLKLSRKNEKREKQEAAVPLVGTVPRVFGSTLIGGPPTRRDFGYVPPQFTPQLTPVRQDDTLINAVILNSILMDSHSSASPQSEPTESSCSYDSSSGSSSSFD